MEPFYGPGEEQSKTKLAITRALHGSLISHRIFVLFTTDRGWTGWLAGPGWDGAESSTTLIGSFGVSGSRDRAKEPLQHFPRSWSHCSTCMDRRCPRAESTSK